MENFATETQETVTTLRDDERSIFLSADKETNPLTIEHVIESFIQTKKDENSATISFTGTIYNKTEYGARCTSTEVTFSVLSTVISHAGSSFYDMFMIAGYIKETLNDAIVAPGDYIEIIYDLNRQIGFVARVNNIELDTLSSELPEFAKFLDDYDYVPAGIIELRAAAASKPADESTDAASL